MNDQTLRSLDDQALMDVVGGGGCGDYNRCDNQCEPRCEVELCVSICFSL
jgi:hypothetical protein